MLPENALPGVCELASIIYFPCGFRDDPKLSDTDEFLIITDSIQNANACASHGLLGIGVTGLGCWRSENSLDYLHEGLAALPLSGRKILIAYSSETDKHHTSLREEGQLSIALRRAGANVIRLRLPDADGIPVGLHQFLDSEGVDGLLKLIKNLEQITDSGEADREESCCALLVARQTRWLDVDMLDAGTYRQLAAISPAKRPMLEAVLHAVKVVHQ